MEQKDKISCSSSSSKSSRSKREADRCSYRQKQPAKLLATMHPQDTSTLMEPSCVLPLSPRQWPVTTTAKKQQQQQQRRLDQTIFSPSDSTLIPPRASKPASFLEYGMLISLLSPDFEGLLAAEGFLSVGLRLEPVMSDGADEAASIHVKSHFKDCLFEVVPKQVYDATNALQLKLDDMKKNKYASTTYSISELKFKSDAEIRLNQLVYEKLLGTQVKYGEIVLLRHLKSNKYVSIEQALVHDLNKGGSKVFLDVDNLHSHFTILPRFKLRKMGESVQMVDQLIFVNRYGRQPLYLYVGQRRISEFGLYEVHASSTTPSSWTALLYDRILRNKNAKEAVEKEKTRGHATIRHRSLRAGDCFRLQHIETGLWLCPQTSKHVEQKRRSSKDSNEARTTGKEGEKKEILDEEDDLAYSVILQPSRRSNLLMYGTKKGGDDDDKDDDEDDDDGDDDGIDKNSDDDSTLNLASSYSLWEVENKSQSVGGSFQWQNTIRLRHVCTGRYLTLHESSVEMRSSSPFAMLSPSSSDNGLPVTKSYALTANRCSVHARSLDATEFRFQSTSIEDSKSSSIDRSGIVRIQHVATHAFLHTQTKPAIDGANKKWDFPPSSSLSSSCSFSGRPLFHSNPLHHHYQQHQQHHHHHHRDHHCHCDPFFESHVALEVEASTELRDEDAFRLFPAKSSEVSDILLLSSMQPVLKKWVDAFAPPSKSSSFSAHLSFDVTANTKLFMAVDEVLSDLIFFCVDVDSDAHDALDVRGVPIRQRQRLFRDQLYIELILDVLKAPFDMYGGPFSVEDLGGLKKSTNDTDDKDEDRNDDKNEYKDKNDNDNDNDDLPKKTIPIQEIQLQHPTLEGVEKMNKEEVIVGQVATLSTGISCSPPFNDPLRIPPPSSILAPSIVTQTNSIPTSAVTTVKQNLRRSSTSTKSSMASTLALDLDLERQQSPPWSSPRGIERKESSTSTTAMPLQKEWVARLKRILNLAHHLLKHVFQGYRKNELYVLRLGLSTLLDLIGHGFGASIPLSCLLRENRNLIQSLNTSIVHRFLKLIQEHGKTVRYLQFLQTLCVAEGHGVPKMQEALSMYLFSPELNYQKTVLIPIRGEENVWCTKQEQLHQQKQEVKRSKMVHEEYTNRPLVFPNQTKGSKGEDSTRDLLVTMKNGRNSDNSNLGGVVDVVDVGDVDDAVVAVDAVDAVAVDAVDAVDVDAVAVAVDDGTRSARRRPQNQVTLTLGGRKTTDEKVMTKISWKESIKSLDKGLAVYVVNQNAAVVEGGERWLSMSEFVQQYDLETSRLGKYLRCQLDLFAALCLDRNYAAIKELRKLLPIENLYHSMVSRKYPPGIQLQCVRLFTVLYIDVEPQRVILAPNNTRVWKELSDELPSHHHVRMHPQHRGKDGRIKKVSDHDRNKTSEELASPNATANATATVAEAQLQTEAQAVAHPEQKKETDNLEEIDFSATSQDEEFYDTLREWIITYLRKLNGVVFVYEDVENRLTLTILKLCFKLVEFGFFSELQWMKRLTPPLVLLLDGRTDTLKKRNEVDVWSNLRDAVSGRLKEKRTARKSVAVTREAHASPKAAHLYEGSMAHSLMDAASTHREMGSQQTHRSDDSENFSCFQKRLVEAGRPRTNLFSHLKRISLSLSRLDPHPNHLVHGTNRNEEIVHELPPSRCYDLKHKDNDPSKVVEDDARARYVFSHQSAVSMYIKEEICNILLYFDNLRLDYQISHLLLNIQKRQGHTAAVYSVKKWIDLFTAWTSKSHMLFTENHLAFSSLPSSSSSMSHNHSSFSPLAKCTFDRKDMESHYSLPRLAERELIPIWIDLMMYEYPPLVARALQLFYHQFNQHDQIISTLPSIQLLVSERNIAIYEELRSKADLLRELSETTEMWMDLTSPEDFNRVESVCTLCEDLTRVMFNELDHRRDIDASVVSVDSMEYVDDSADETCISPPKKNETNVDATCIPTSTAAAAAAAAVSRNGFSNAYSSTVHARGTSISIKDDHLETISSQRIGGEVASSSNSFLASPPLLLSKVVNTKVVEQEKETKSEKTAILAPLPPSTTRLKSKPTRCMPRPMLGRVMKGSSSYRCPNLYWTQVLSSKKKVDINSEARRLVFNLQTPQYVLHLMLDGLHVFNKCHLPTPLEEGKKDWRKKDEMVLKHILAAQSFHMTTTTTTNQGSVHKVVDKDKGKEEEEEEERRLVKNSSFLGCSSRRSAIRGVFKACLNFLSTLAENNLKHQMYLSEYKSLFLPIAGELPEGQALLVAIYCNHSSMLQKIPEDLCLSFLNFIATKGPIPRFLLFLEAVVAHVHDGLGHRLGDGSKSRCSSTSNINSNLNSKSRCSSDSSQKRKMMHAGSLEKSGALVITHNQNLIIRLILNMEQPSKVLQYLDKGGEQAPQLLELLDRLTRQEEAERKPETGKNKKEGKLNHHGRLKKDSLVAPTDWNAKTILCKEDDNKEKHEQEEEEKKEQEKDDDDDEGKVGNFNSSFLPNHGPIRPIRFVDTISTLTSTASTTTNVAFTSDDCVNVNGVTEKTTCTKSTTTRCTATHYFFCPTKTKTKTKTKTHARFERRQSWQFIEYHIRLLHVLCACATFQNTSVQKACQAILPPPSLMTLLNHPKCSLAFQIPLLRFVREVYLNTDDPSVQPSTAVMFSMLTYFKDAMVQATLSLLRCVAHLDAAQSSKEARSLNHPTPRGIETKGTLGETAKDSSTKSPRRTSDPPAATSSFSSPSSSPSSFDDDDDEEEEEEEEDEVDEDATGSKNPTCKHKDFLFLSMIPTIVSLLNNPQSSSLLQNSRTLAFILAIQHCVEIVLHGLAMSNWLDSEEESEELHHLIVLLDDLCNQNLASRWNEFNSRPQRVNFSAFSISDDIEPVLRALRTITNASHEKESLRRPAESTSRSNFQMSRAASLKQRLSDAVGVKSGAVLTGIQKISKRYHSDHNIQLDASMASSSSSTIRTKPNPRKQKLRRQQQQQQQLQQRSHSGIHGLFRLPLVDENERDQSVIENFLRAIRMNNRVQEATKEEFNFMLHCIINVKNLFHEDNLALGLQVVDASFEDVISKMIAHVRICYKPSYHRMNLTLLGVFCRMITSAQSTKKRHEMQCTLDGLGASQLVIFLISTTQEEAIFNQCIELGIALLYGLNAQVQESFYTAWIEKKCPDNFFAQIQQQIIKAGAAARAKCSDQARTAGIAAIILPTLEPRFSFGSTPGKVANALRVVDRRPPYYHEVDDPQPPHLGTSSTKSTFPWLQEHLPIHAIELQDQRTTRLPGFQENTNGDDMARITRMFRFLQLLCEGHNSSMQKYFISQAAPPVAGFTQRSSGPSPGRSSSVNLVEATMNCLLDLYSVVDWWDVHVIIQLFQTLTEFCQGPCEEAQETVANYKFLSVVNTLLMHSMSRPIWHGEGDGEGDGDGNTSNIRLIRELRAAIVITLLSLLEGRNDTIIHERLLQELSVDALKENLIQVYDYFHEHYQGRYAGNEECATDPYLSMGFDLFVLIKHLLDVNPQRADCFRPEKLPFQPEEHHRLAKKTSLVKWLRDSIVWTTAQATATAKAKFRSSKAKVLGVSSSPALLNQRVDPTKYAHAYGFFHARTAKVEILWTFSNSQKELLPFYFAIHPICFCLTKASKNDLVWRVERGATKLTDFYRRSDDLVNEMQHQSRLAQYPALWAFSQSGPLLQNITFALAISLNILILFFYRADDDDDGEPFLSVQDGLPWSDRSQQSKSMAFFMHFLGSLQVVFSMGVLLVFLLNQGPILIKRRWQDKVHAEAKQRAKGLNKAPVDHYHPCGASSSSLSSSSSSSSSTSTSSSSSSPSSQVESMKDFETMLRALQETNDFIFYPPREEKSFESLRGLARSIRYLCMSPPVVYYTAYAILAFLGSSYHPIYFAFHLLDVANRHQELKNVLRAIVRPGKALILTVILYLIISYIFAIIGFFYFRRDFSPEALLDSNHVSNCRDLFHCFLTTLDRGFKFDGLGGYLIPRFFGMDKLSYERFLFDLLHNVILVVVLLNIVFGVIIDTFAELRLQHKEKIDNMSNRCFICSIDRYSFDRLTKRGFDFHTKFEHNKWHYIYLFAHIRKKSMTEYNGVELYLARKMVKGDVSFFPVHRAMTLEKVDEEFATKQEGSTPDVMATEDEDDVKKEL